MFKKLQEDERFLNNFQLDSSRRFLVKCGQCLRTEADAGLFFFSILSMFSLCLRITLEGRYTQPPRAMIAAQSRIMTTAPNSP